MRMQIAADIIALDQRRQFPGLGRLDLAPVFAQFRRDELQSEFCIDFLFSGAGDRNLAPEKAVLVEQKSFFLRDSPEMDAVGLRAGEVHHRGTVALARNDAQIDVQSAVERDAGLGFAPGDNFGDARERNQLLHHGRRLARYRKQVEVADGFLAPAEAACGFDPLYRAAFPHMREQLFDDERGFRVKRPHRRMGFHLGEMLEYLMLHFRPEAAQRGYRAGLRRFLEVREAADLELVAERSHSFRTKPGNAEQFDQAGRNLLLKLAMERQPAGFQNRRDFAREVGADAWQFLYRLGRHVGKLPGAIADGARGVAIGADAEEIILADFEHVGDFVEDVRDLVVLHRTAAVPSKSLYLMPQANFTAWQYTSQCI